MNQEPQDVAPGDGSPGPDRASRLPLILGIAGAVLGAAAFGFVIANAVGGGSDQPAASDREPTAPSDGGSPTDNDGTPGADSTPGGGQTPAPDATQPRASATAQPTEPGSTPGATPVPTATPAASAITWSKFFDMFRAEGGTTAKSANTGLPFRRVEAAWDNSYKNCPGSDCVRGKATVWTAVGPGAVAESLEASSQVYNTFVAERRDATLLMDLRWKGQLAAVLGANATAAVEVEILVRELDGNRVVRTLPNMPYSVYSGDLGVDAISGADVLEVDEKRSVALPLKLEPETTYRIDLILTCSARASLSATTTQCNFWGDGMGVEWTKQQVEYDSGICTPTQKGEGCFYPN